MHPRLLAGTLAVAFGVTGCSSLSSRDTPPETTREADPAKMASLEADGLRVFFPKGVWPGCPAHPLPLIRADLTAARSAVLLALPRVFRGGTPPIDTRGATATVFRASREGEPRVTTACGEFVEARTGVVALSLPKVAPWSASISRPIFAVSRTPRGWLIWEQIH